MLLAGHKVDEDTGSDQTYNAYDACLTYEIYDELLKQVHQAQPAYDFELALQGPVLEMMLRGMCVNPSARHEGIVAVKADLEYLNACLQRLAFAIWDKGVNANSGAQLKDLFYNHLGVTPVKAWVKGELKYPMDRETLEKVGDYFQARPLVEIICAIRDFEKTLQVLEMEVDPDWRMRTSYNIGGTKSARFSSSKSSTGTGGNFQNITEDLRHILIADPGHIMCGIDASQSDSRMVGFMCGVLFADWTYLDACESGDLHTSVARMVWPELAWTGDLKKDRELAEQPYYRHFDRRVQCKRIGHGANFLGKAPTLAKGAHVPVKLVENFLERYFTAFSCIQKWHVWTAGELQRNQRLTSIHGRTRDFFDRTDADETVRKALAFLAAAPTADNLNLGMWRIWKHMPEVKLLAQVHDAVYFQFPEGLDANIIVPRAQKLLETPLRVGNRVFIVPTDAKTGYNFGNWAEKNPRGLRKFVQK